MHFALAVLANALVCPVGIVHNRSNCYGPKHSARSYGSPVLMCGGKVECLIAYPGALVLCVLEFQRGVSMQLLLYRVVFLATSAHNPVFAV